MDSKISQKKKLVVLGTGTFAEEVADLAEDTGRYEVVAFIENWDKEKTRQSKLGKPVIWIDDAAQLSSNHEAVCALSTTQRWGFVETAAKMGFEFAKLIHPTARLSTQSVVGVGSLLSVGVIVAAHTAIGRHVIINRGCLIGHHTTLQDCVTVSPGANIAGAVTIGEGTYVGMGAVILDHLKIGSHSVIGAGAVVTRDVPDHVQVMGVPAKTTKENIQGK
jgi:sugar O-acyltransferase (sialic acid O-acetyltransferase NeuD family)